jgi:hypothetical protein
MGYVLGAWNPPPLPPGEPDNASKARGADSGGLGEGASRPMPMKTRFPKWGALLWSFAGWLWKGLGSRWKPRPCGNAEDAFQSIVHVVHHDSGWHRQGVQDRLCSSLIVAGPGEGQLQQPLTVDGSGDVLGPSLGLGDVDGRSLLRLKRSLPAV